MSVAILCWLIFAVAASAQPLPFRPPGPLAPPEPQLFMPSRPIPPAAPLLNVRVVGGEGLKATFYRGMTSQTFDAPVSVGVRPGYIYRFKLTGLPQGADLALYPTIEVIGTLHMPANLCGCDHPLPLAFNREDIDRALDGIFTTKVIVLEHPDQAVPVATSADQPLENEVPATAHLIEEARRVGRPMVILRLGQRQVTEEELAAQSIPGTMLFPDEKFTGPAARPPCLPWAGFQVWDPYIGPRFPEEECMHDGGDCKLPVGQDPNGKLGGFEPTDTIAQYADHNAKRHIAVSNRVCLCVPRFVVIRQVIAPMGTNIAVLPIVNTGHKEPVVVLTDIGPRQKQQIEQPGIILIPTRPAATVNTIAPVELDHWLSTGLIIGSIKDQVVIGTPTKPEPPGRPLIICKSIDKQCAHIGDVVTFTLKYTNPGWQPIRDIVVSDSLTGRLEYVAGSGKSDRDAVFTSKENEAGSLILRWEISGDLLPGHTGIISFQTKIR